MEDLLFSTIAMREIVNVVVRTTLIFMYAFVLLRLLGKRRLSHFGYIDLLLIIAFGSAVGDVMIYGESTIHLISSMVAITVVSILVKLLNEFSSHSSLGNKLVDGQARLLIDKGLVVEGSLQKEDLDEEKLNSYLREKGIDSVKRVRKAFIEPDGEISVIPYSK
jgi:uncharacterized membrane protein YcaP (DUF421 family)